MKKRHTLLLMAALCTMMVWGQEMTPPTPHMKTQTCTKPGVRWWWLGSAVDDDGLRWSLREYAKAGIGAVEITPIYGVQGNESRDLPFLSPAWMHALQTVVDEGRRLGIRTDMNLGTGWPFGGPLTPIDEAACKARFVIDTVAAGQPANKAIAQKERDYARLLCERRYPLSNGQEQVIQLYQSRTRQKVKRAAPGGEGYVIDHFDRMAVRHYLDRFESAFTDSIDLSTLNPKPSTLNPQPSTLNPPPFPAQFFNDSYEVYDANWTPTLLDEFARRRGYRLEEHLRELIGLVDDGNQVLSDYRETLSDLLLENFTEQWTTWAHSHGVATRNQAHGSPANLIDVYAAVDVPEIEGFGLTNFGIKGLRTDPGMTRKNDSDVSMLKYAASAAHITGKPLTSSETCTWLTEHFRTSLSQMKPDIDLMFTCGVNHVFFHGTAYSPKDEPWPGWKFYASVDISHTNSIWRDMPYLMQYIERCQRFLQWGQPDNDVLVYLPVRDMWRKRLYEGERGLLMQFDIHTMADKAPEFIHSILQIDSLGYDSDYISDRLLLSTTYTDGMLQTAAGTRYHALIIPGSGRLPEAVQTHVEALRQQGATIIRGVDARQLSHAAKAEPMRTDWHLRAIRRRHDGGHHYFIANLTPHDVDATVPLAVEERGAGWYDPMTGLTQPARLTSEGVHIALRSGESRILMTWEDSEPGQWVENADRDKTGKKTKAKPSAKGTREVIDLTHQPWSLQFIESAPEVNRVFHLDRLQTWETLDDDAVQVTMGTGVYTTTVRLNRNEACEDWHIDLGDVRESARVYINDTFIGCAWAVPFTLDCKGALRKGKNTIRIEVTNLPANRIAHLDRQGIPWRRFKEINFVDRNYQHTTYGQWAPMPSGLNSTVKLTRAAH